MISGQLPLAISPKLYSTFEQFYSTESNRPVVECLRSFVNLADPFVFLWGGTSSGVTHLLEATLLHHQTLSSQYLPLSQLLDYPPAELLEGMENFDLLCIDDLQEICGHKPWEQSLFHLFNRLRDTGKKLLIGSHQPPRQLPLELADLQSRLQWCTVFQLSSLDDMEKQELMIFIAEQLGLKLPMDVVNYLMTRVTRSTGDLVGLIKRLDQASLAEQRKLTIPFVKTVLAAP